MSVKLPDATAPIEPVNCSIRDGAKIIGISTATLRRQYINTGKIVVYKCGHRSLLKVARIKEIAERLPEAEVA